MNKLVYFDNGLLLFAQTQRKIKLWKKNMDII